jgi:hypothetical protein
MKLDCRIKNIKLDADGDDITLVLESAVDMGKFLEMKKIWDRSVCEEVSMEINLYDGEGNKIG